MLALFHIQEKRIFTGNILFIVCCAFYLAWWILAFRPAAAVNGAKTGWLLIPASLAGISGVILIISGMTAQTHAKHLLPAGYILWGGLASFFILLAVTVLLFKRPLTTELILIVGWGMLALAEINALYASGLFSHKLSATFFVVIFAAVAISLVCYVLYYRLDSRASYIAGMIPLLMTALVMAGIAGFMLMAKH